jgi:hypothetical protein
LCEFEFFWLVRALASGEAGEREGSFASASERGGGYGIRTDWVRNETTFLDCTRRRAREERA